MAIRDHSAGGTDAGFPAERHASAAQRLWVPVWARMQRASLTRRCIMCRDLVGDRPGGESPLYCSVTCRDLHRTCGG